MSISPKQGGTRRAPPARWARNPCKKATNANPPHYLQKQSENPPFAPSYKDRNAGLKYSDILRNSINAAALMGCPHNRILLAARFERDVSQGIGLGIGIGEVGRG